MAGILDMAEDELRMVREASDRYGQFYENAAEVTLLFSRMVQYDVSTPEVCYRFHAQAKKHHTLSLLSTVRRHRIQANQNLRYFLESAVISAYALKDRDFSSYFDLATGIPVESRKVSAKAYTWVAAEYPWCSDQIREMKQAINDHLAHSNIAASHATFHAEGKRIHAPFFDREDFDLERFDLWTCARAGLVALQLLMCVRQQYGGFLSNDDIDVRWKPIQDSQETLIGEFLNLPRFDVVKRELAEQETE